MLCPRCKTKMRNIMHFEKNKNYMFHLCEKCLKKTHPKRIHFESEKTDCLYKNSKLKEKKNDTKKNF